MTIEIKVKLYDRIYADLSLILEKHECAHLEHNLVDWSINQVLKEALLRYRVGKYMEGREEEVKKKIEEMKKKTGSAMESVEGLEGIMAITDPDTLMTVMKELSEIQRMQKADEAMFDQWQKEYEEEEQE